MLRGKFFALLFAALALFAFAAPSMARPPGESFDKGAVIQDASHISAPQTASDNFTVTVGDEFNLPGFLKGSSVKLFARPIGEGAFEAIGGGDGFSSFGKPCPRPPLS